MICDLLTAGLILDLLRRLGRPQAWALVYLWNPLVLVEFAHGAHVDALMILLTVAPLWLHIATRSRWLSVLTLAGATLTKGLPVLLLPLLARRWGRRCTAAFFPRCCGMEYLILIVAFCLLFALGAAPAGAGRIAGWGLTGPLDGTGVFGALRIYAQQWNYNSGLYYWVEVALTGYRTSGSVPVEAVGWRPILAAKLCTGVALVFVLVSVWRAYKSSGHLALLRWAAVTLGAYLLLTSTVHPWYATVLVPFLPFLLAKPAESCHLLGKEERRTAQRFLWPVH